MKIVIFGSTGFIGKKLKSSLEADQHTVIPLDIRRDPHWEEKISDCDAVINLGGAPIFGKRWNQTVKSELFDSRSESTKKIVDAIGTAKKNGKGPQTFICASAIGFYGAQFDDLLEETSPAGFDFLARVCSEWENQAKIAERVHKVRTVLLRTGIVLGKDGGALAQMLPPFKFGLGGPLGSGRQWFSWIHLDDEIGIIKHALNNSQLSGAINLTAPEPVTNKEFSKTLGKVLGRPVIFPVPSIAVYALFGEAAEILLSGQRVIPKIALSTGYRFKFTNVEAALRDIL